MRKASRSTIMKKAWAKRKAKQKPDPMTTENITKAAVKLFNQNNDYIEEIDKAVNIKTPKSFADCMFEIINSSMDQSAKQMAFEAMKVAAINGKFEY